MVEMPAQFDDFAGIAVHQPRQQPLDEHIVGDLGDHGHVLLAQRDVEHLEHLAVERDVRGLFGQLADVELRRMVDPVPLGAVFVGEQSGEDDLNQLGHRFIEPAEGQVGKAVEAAAAQTVARSP